MPNDQSVRLVFSFQTHSTFLFLCAVITYWVPVTQVRWMCKIGYCCCFVSYFASLYHNREKMLLISQELFSILIATAWGIRVYVYKSEATYLYAANMFAQHKCIHLHKLNQLWMEISAFHFDSSGCVQQLPHGRPGRAHTSENCLQDSERLWALLSWRADPAASCLLIDCGSSVHWREKKRSPQGY